ncbi:MAG: hypothetical protein ACQES1_08295 [Bacteroidota bacterium]
MMKTFAQSLVLLSLLAVMIFFSACKQEPAFIEQDRIYTSYELYYNGNTGQTYAGATFKFSSASGTVLKLGENSSIGFIKVNPISDPDPLHYINEYGYYEKEYTTRWLKGRFYFTDENDNQYENEITVHVAAFPETIDTIVKGNRWELSWEGFYNIEKTALGENESISFSLKEEGEGDIHTFHQHEEGAESIALEGDETAALPEGEYILSLERRYQPELVQKTGAGGTITGRFRPADRTVVVVDE